MSGELFLEDFPDDSLFNVSIEQIIPNPKQPRKYFSEKSLQELAKSISIQGVIQPLIVRKHPSLENIYELVAGERRWRALQQLEVYQVPVVLRRIKDEELLEISLLENIQRENLTIIEEAQSYQDLLQLNGYTQEELAQRIGKDRSTVSNLIRLLQLPSELKNDLERGRISNGHARAILALPNRDSQLEMRQGILRNSWSVRETEQKIRKKLDFLLIQTEKQNGEIVSSLSSENKNSNNQKHIKSLEEELEHKLGTRVKIKFLSGKGHIKIDYFSLEEFEHLYDLLVSS
mgnify:CR=1 FL=1